MMKIAGARKLDCCVICFTMYWCAVFHRSGYSWIQKLSWQQRKWGCKQDDKFFDVWIKDIVDTSSRGQWHNEVEKNLQTQAEAMQRAISICLFDIWHLTYSVAVFRLPSSPSWFVHSNCRAVLISGWAITIDFYCCPSTAFGHASKEVERIRIGIVESVIRQRIGKGVSSSLSRMHRPNTSQKNELITRSSLMSIARLHH